MNRNDEKAQNPKPFARAAEVKPGDDHYVGLWKKEPLITILPRNNKLKPTDPSPHFTRRDYIWLASAMKQILSEAETELSFEYPELDAIKEAIKMFANLLAANNPRFDKELFLSNVFDSVFNSKNPEPSQ